MHQLAYRFTCDVPRCDAVEYVGIEVPPGGTPPSAAPSDAPPQWQWWNGVVRCPAHNARRYPISMITCHLGTLVDAHLVPAVLVHLVDTGVIALNAAGTHAIVPRDLNVSMHNLLKAAVTSLCDTLPAKVLELAK